MSKGKVMKLQGTRGKGKARVVWTKINFINEPLMTEDNDYLNELFRLRSQLVEGKGNEDKHYEMQGRQEHVMGFLYDSGVDTNDFYCSCDKYCN